ncbi:MAG: hypothetical protein O3B41_11665 [Bacteroidetes bacterium]|nr:hypothetical protein [Bacteroidota bacterium]
MTQTTPKARNQHTCRKDPVTVSTKLKSVETCHKDGQIHLPTLRDVDAELMALRLAVRQLGEVAGSVTITDGDTTCTLDYWCREALKAGGQ